jgi:hypothetical protein
MEKQVLSQVNNNNLSFSILVVITHLIGRFGSHTLFVSTNLDRCHKFRAEFVENPGSWADYLAVRTDKNNRF